METCSERKRWVINWSKPVDRDALLELADEIESAGYNEWLYSGDFEQDDIARRIREACGEAEHGR